MAALTRSYKNIISQNVQNEKFQSKRWKEYQTLLKQKFHTRTSIWIQLPDGYILQGTFGAMERMEQVYDFIKENLFDKEWPFSLFEPTPRRVFDSMPAKLYDLGLVP